MFISLDHFPFTITIAGIELTVKEMPPKKNSEDGTPLGMSHYGSQSIFLKTKGIGQDLIQQALYHEILHWIFFLMNENEICNDEKLIDQAALLLHSAIKSI